MEVLKVKEGRGVSDIMWEGLNLPLIEKRIHKLSTINTPLTEDFKDWGKEPEIKGCRQSLEGGNSPQLTDTKNQILAKHQLRKETEP